MDSLNSVALCPSHPLLLAGPLHGIQCPHRPDVSKFLLELSNSTKLKTNQKYEYAAV